MKKTLVALASAGMLIVGALPAFGQGGVNASISGVGNGQTVQGSITITGSGSASTGVDTITISVNNSALKSQSWGGIQQNASTSVTWNTNGYANGDYTVKVTATSNGGSSNSATARVLVDNAPSTPSGLYTSHSDGVVTFGWSRNPESDVYAYRVSRDGTFLTETAATSITDQPGPGDHSYSVTAVRRSPTNGNGKTGGTATTAINVPNPPPASSGDPGTGAPGYGTGGSNSGSGSYGNPNAGNYGNPNAGNGSGGGRQYGYNGGKGDKNGNAPGGVSGYGSFFAGGPSLAGIGLPNNLTLPGSRLTGYTPGASGQAIEDGTFEENLPYDLSDGQGEAELLGETGGLNVAARRTSFLIPPDGLRWIAAGLWFIVAAALLKFLERIVAKREEEEAAALTAAPEPDAEAEDAGAEQRAITPKIKLLRRKDDAA